MINEDEYEWLEGLVTACASDLNRLSDWEKGFWDDQLDRLKTYENTINLSPKQWEILYRIAGKVDYALPGGGPREMDDAI